MQRRGAPGWQRWMLGVSAAGVVFGVSGMTLASAVAAASTGDGSHVPGAGLCIGNLVCLGSTPSPSAKPGASGSGSNPLLPITGALATPAPSSNGLCVLGTLCVPNSNSVPTLPPNPVTGPGNPGTGSNPGHHPSGGTGGAAPGGSGGGSAGSIGGGASTSTAAASSARLTHDFAGGSDGGSTLPSSAGLTVPPPPPIQLATMGGSPTFGSAPFLWPLFVGLDLLGFAAVTFVLRRTWSKPVAD